MSAQPKTTIEDVLFPLRSGIELADKVRRSLWGDMKTPEAKERYTHLNQALEEFRAADRNARILAEKIKRLEQKAKFEG